MRLLFTSALAGIILLRGLAAGDASVAAEVVAPPAADTLDDPTPGDVVSALVVRATLDGTPLRGAWFKLAGHCPNAETVLETQWFQRSGPRYKLLRALRGQRELWLCLNTPGQYDFAFRARSADGWSAPSDVQFAIGSEPPFLLPEEALKYAGSCERVVLPGGNWRQIVGPIASLAAQQDAGGYTVRPNDPGLYLFEAPRLTLDALPMRRGIFVPAARDGKSGDRRPIARLAERYAGIVGLPVEIDGGLSTDPDPGDAAKLTARWSTPDARLGAAIVPQLGLSARFTATTAGMYTIALVVSDDRLDSEPARAFVEIADGAPTRSGVNPLLEGPLGFPETPADNPAAVLEKRVTLALWPPEALPGATPLAGTDGGLQRAIDRFPPRCGTILRVDAGVAKAGHFHEVPLALEARQTPLRHLLDGIARQTDTRYRRDGNRGFWLLRPEDAARDEAVEISAANLDALFEKPDAAEVMEPLRRFAEPILRGHPDASLSYDTDRHAASAMLPGTAAKHIREIVRALREPAPQDLPLPVEYIPAAILKNQLGEKTATLKGTYRLDNLVRELAEQSGLAIGFDPRQFGRVLPHLKVNFDHVCMRQVLRDLVEDAGFDGCSIEAPAGVWFYKGSQPYPSGELLYDSAYVVAYDLTPLYRDLKPEAALMLNGETIEHFLRSRVYPDSWNEPGVFMFYHAPTRKLVVLHGQWAHVRIVELLTDLRDRGEWALGVTY
jgi:hypothetical protein